MGQVTKDMLLVGQAGLSPEVLGELRKLLATHELVKLRFVGADRHQRAALCEDIARMGPCEHVGSVGNTALFFVQNPDAKARVIKF